MTRFTLLLLTFTLACAVAVVAQSGRRVPKTAPAPVPVPQKESPTSKEPEKPKAGLTFILGMDRFESLVALRATHPGSVLLTVTDRLNDSPGVVVEQVQADMTRGEAVRRARTEKEAYVVLLELVVDRMSSSNSDNPQLCLQYWVFSPTTGKIKTSGATYSHTTRSGGVILTRRMPDVLRDHNLQQASREAAERILAAFKLQPDGSRIPRSY